MEQLSLDMISRHTKDGKLTKSKEHSFMKQKLCLTNLTAIHNEATNSMSKERGVDVVYLNMSKVSASFPLNPHR